MTAALFLTREALVLGSDRELRRLYERGGVTRLRAGVYLDSAIWRSMDADERYRTRVRAAALTSHHGAQFSHDSAAAMWHLPTIGRWPDSVHELVGPRNGGTSRVGIRRHALGTDGSAAVHDGVTVTSLPRTVVDMACSTSFVRAVAMADAALGNPHGTTALGTTTAEQLRGVADELEPYRGLVRARRVLEFATASSGSPGESFARVQFHALRLPAPELQVPFFDEDGYIGTADFYWSALRLIGEFDGMSKYGPRRRFQRGLTAAQIVQTEKAREDRLRRVSSGFVRLTWALTSDRQRLAALLRSHGLTSKR